MEEIVIIQMYSRMIAMNLLAVMTRKEFRSFRGKIVKNELVSALKKKYPNQVFA